MSVEGLQLREILASLSAPIDSKLIKKREGHSFVSACKAAGIVDLHFHDLRHSFVTRSAAAGILPMISMKLAPQTQHRPSLLTAHGHKRG